MSVCGALEEANVRILRKMVSGPDSAPVWWDSAVSYKEHTERQRLESLLEAISEASDDDDGDDEADEDDGDQIFLSSEKVSTPILRDQRRASLAAPSLVSSTSPLPPMKRHPTSVALSRGSVFSLSTSTTTITPLMPQRERPVAIGKQPDSALRPARASMTRRESSSSPSELPDDLRQRVQSLSIFPKLAALGSAPLLVTNSPTRLLPSPQSLAHQPRPRARAASLSFGLP